jgi:hypothetical protein
MTYGQLLFACLVPLLFFVVVWIALEQAYQSDFRREYPKPSKRTQHIERPAQQPQPEPRQEQPRQAEPRQVERRTEWQPQPQPQPRTSARHEPSASTGIVPGMSNFEYHAGMVDAAWKQAQRYVDSVSLRESKAKLDALKEELQQTPSASPDHEWLLTAVGELSAAIDQKHRRMFDGK